MRSWHYFCDDALKKAIEGIEDKERGQRQAQDKDKDLDAELNYLCGGDW